MSCCQRSTCSSSVAAVGKARSSRELVELVARLGQAMDRLVVHDAQPVLDPAQEPVALIEELELASAARCPARAAARSAADVPVVRSSGCAWPCTSCRYCAANSTSITPPAPVLRSLGAAELALDPLAHRRRSRRRSRARDRRAARRTRSRRRARATSAPSARSPATGRSLISAWRSHSRASLARDSGASRRATTRAGPASPIGRSRVSTS